MNLGIRKRETYCLCDIYMYIYFFSFFMSTMYLNQPGLISCVWSLHYALDFINFKVMKYSTWVLKGRNKGNNHSSTRYHRLNGKEATISWYVMQTRTLFLDITPVLSLLDRVSCDISIGLVSFLWCNILFLYVN